MRRAVVTPSAPAAIGPYSQGIMAGPYLFCSGQIPLDPETGQLVSADIGAQTHRVFKNIAAILERAGSSLDDVVKTTVYLADMSDFAGMNDVYAQYFSNPAPARSTV